MNELEWCTDGMIVTREIKSIDVKPLKCVYHKHHIDWPGIEPGLLW
jgi:hypothetical protein